MLAIRTSASQRSGQSGWSSLCEKQKEMLGTQFCTVVSIIGMPAAEAQPLLPGRAVAPSPFNPLPLSHLSLRCLGTRGALQPEVGHAGARKLKEF